MGSLSAPLGSGLRTVSLTTQIWIFFVFVILYCDFFLNSNSNDRHNHVSKFSRLHPPEQQTQNCVTSAAAAALLNDSAASASTAAATTYCSSNPHKTYTCCCYNHTTRQLCKNKTHTCFYWSSQRFHCCYNLSKSTQTANCCDLTNVLVTKHYWCCLSKLSARHRAQKNPTSNPQSRCVQLLCYKSHTHKLNNC